MSISVKGIILAGGSGSRLWPLSRQQLPKQFLKLSGAASMLSATIGRLSPLVAKDDVWVVTGESHATGEAFSELEGLNQIMEPCGRNTAPAIAVAAALMQDLSGDDPIMVVLPADHIVADKDAFQACLNKAVEVAQGDRLVTFGIVPTQPETGFGYIQAEASGQGDIQNVLRFVEKPDLENAQRMLDDGNYYWNSGMFVWKASVILEEVEKYIPEMTALLNGMRARWNGGELWQEVVRDSFDKMPDVSIDYGIMEKSQRVSLVPADIGWSDVGSWDAVHEIAEHDVNGNDISGNVLAIDCHNTLLRSERSLIAAIGIEDIIAVETPDAILLCRAGESQRVREIVDSLKLGKERYHLEHVTVRRPWGSYTVLEGRADGYQIKRLEVLPGARLSMQAHQHRSEHWVVVAGTATVTCGELVKTVAKNESAYISIGETHRLENRGKIPLHLIEVQVGDYLGEDDIERFEDIYGRT
ncbi:mannose-1-phosphate guanylyltransferase [Mariprofundus aestuarium]|uniref:mannose-1-phosphate guanylyltransferase n=1 Tax=Mariprofundus aestuarium TaxID=1921086 RepID=A0A2K8L5H9_MARES|nr:mannose-1-phosphate guanylyltransferase/mannose-6-phosphate isomerase [Mariprofundus aestuarium]ATX80244.1 mannose-1-phosphate guanylyltransferase [Mariprofundus aestuarium]